MSTIISTMSTIRCKFTCTRVMSEEVWDYAEKRPKVIYGVEFRPVYSADPNHENKKFWDATPTGSLTLGTIKQVPWEVGKECYVDITPAPNTEE